MATSFKREYEFSDYEQCSFCRKPINQKAGYIYWVTGENHMIFHRECAEHFSIGLAFDSVKLKYEQRGMKIPFSDKETTQ